MFLSTPNLGYDSEIADGNLVFFYDKLKALEHLREWKPMLKETMAFLRRAHVTEKFKDEGDVFDDALVWRYLMRAAESIKEEE